MQRLPPALRERDGCHGQVGIDGTTAVSCRAGQGPRQADGYRLANKISPLMPSQPARQTSDRCGGRSPKTDCEDDG